MGDESGPSPAPLLCTFQDCLGDIVDQLRRDNYVGMIFVDASTLSKVEKVHGADAYDELLADMGRMLVGLQSDVIRSTDLIAVNGDQGEQFIIVLSEKRSGPPLVRADLEAVADRIHVSLLPGLDDLTREFMADMPKLNVGFAAAIYNPMLRSERIIYRMLDEARRMARYQRFRFSTKSKERLRDLIFSKSITTLFQPIVDLFDGSIFGYEALSRGPKGSEFENPRMLFGIAEDSDLLFELDHLCRTQAIENAQAMTSDCRLFVNTLPTSIHDPTFRGEYLDQMLELSELAPSNIVFEITEALAIEGRLHFQAALSELRDTGFAIAIDDAGTGYASLETIMHLRPSYIKIDMSLIRHIDGSPLKRELIKALSSLAGELRAALVAEGIETAEELQALRDLGIRYGQGFAIAHPGPPFPKPRLPQP